MRTTIWRLSISAILIGLLFYILPSKIMEIITLLAVIVALFKDDLYSFHIPPNLVITSSSGPRHFNVAPLRSQQTGQFEGNQAYYGVIVENHGIGKAKDVELAFTGLRSNRVANFDRFLSLPLVRSWIHSPIVNTIHAGIPIRFDICFIRESNPNTVSFAFLRTPNELIDVSCDAPEESFFEFEVVASSKNAPLARSRIRISYNGNYIQGFNVS